MKKVSYAVYRISVQALFNSEFHGDWHRAAETRRGMKKQSIIVSFKAKIIVGHFEIH